jgi:putative transport protein
MITLIPMIITALIARTVYKTNLLTLLGALAGGMTSTPGLAAISPMTKSNAPQIAYATVYPISMVLLVLVVKLLALFT